MTKTKILADSVNPSGQRIVTFLATYPRYIHAEVMTHRAFARNAGSSRAVPIKRLMADVKNSPVVPARWGKNQSGMQSFEEMEALEQTAAEKIWRATLGDSLTAVSALLGLGLHKQWANRLIEPWMHITVLITATEWGNFFNLRAHPAAMPDFQQLTFRMLHRYHTSVPAEKAWGEWHIPFAEQMPGVPDNGDVRPITPHEMLKVATARAARLSYLNHDNVIDPIKDFGLHDGLAENGHWSPFEHTAIAENEKPDYWEELQGLLWESDRNDLMQKLAGDLYRDQGSFKGWTPYRKRFADENRSEFDPEALLAQKPDWITLED